ncbi:MAG: hypothetical protein DMG37_11930 [Acidobacteria bacterium]|nr:MAG: hypothetical protein DMG37_11930 [Acidobacteriota bacterium]
MARSRVLDSFSTTRALIAAFLSLTLLISPPWAAASTAFGTLVFANRARVGNTNASVGATVFSGDRLSTDEIGSVQIRAGAARLLLASASAATLSQEEVSPAATLTAGTATFSTANSKAFVLHVASAIIRPNTDQPTIGKVTVLNPKELVVKSVRGSLQISVEDDVREIPEGEAYRIVLDPNADPQGPRGAGTKGMGGPPIKAAKSRFIWYAVAITGGLTIYVAHEAWESAYKP